MPGSPMPQKKKKKLKSSNHTAPIHVAQTPPGFFSRHWASRHLPRKFFFYTTLLYPGQLTLLLSLFGRLSSSFSCSKNITEWKSVLKRINKSGGQKSFLFLFPLSDYGLRLEGGSTSEEGRVMVGIGDQWGTLCTSQTDGQALLRTADVICRELGLGLALQFFGECSWKTEWVQRSCERLWLWRSKWCAYVCIACKWIHLYFLYWES